MIIPAGTYAEQGTRPVTGQKNARMNFFGIDMQSAARLEKEHPMTGDLAIAATQQIPDHYKRMETLACDKCHAHFLIIHPMISTDRDRAKKQAERLKRNPRTDHE